LVFSSTQIFAQELNLDKIVPPEEVRPNNFEDYLVQLAWKNTPINGAFDHQIEIFELDKKIAKKAWMNDMSALFSINDISLSQIVFPDNDRLVLFPIYNIQAGLNLGTIFTTKNRVQAAEQRKLMTLLDKDQKKIKTRRDVLETYQVILNAEEILKVRTENEENVYDNYVLTTEKFKNGEVQFEDLNQSVERLSQAREGVTNATGEIQIAIVRIEELIAIPWEQALKYRKKLEDKEKRKSRLKD